MSIKYTHCPDVGGPHDVLPSVSDAEYSQDTKLITFKKYKRIDGAEVENSTGFPVTEGFPNTFSGTIPGWGDITGFFIVTDNSKGIYGAIKRAHSHDGSGNEDDTGTFSGTHNQ